MSFVKRMLFFFIPSMVALILMQIAGITQNLFMTAICLLAIVWMLQAIYKIILQKKEDKENDSDRR